MPIGYDVDELEDFQHHVNYETLKSRINAIDNSYPSFRAIACQEISHERAPETLLTQCGSRAQWSINA